MKLSQGSPQQQAAMQAYRATARKKYTQAYPNCVSFAAEVELLEALLRRHWDRQQASALMTFLLNASWDFYAPYIFIRDYVHKAVESIQNGMSFTELEASGLLESEGSLFPIDNIPAEHKPFHELMAFDEELKAGPPVKMKDRIKLMQKGAKFGQRSDN